MLGPLVGKPLHVVLDRPKILELEQFLLLFTASEFLSVIDGTYPLERIQGRLCPPCLWAVRKQDCPLG